MAADAFRCEHAWMDIETLTEERNVSSFEVILLEYRLMLLSHILESKKIEQSSELFSRNFAVACMTGYRQETAVCRR